MIRIAVRNPSERPRSGYVTMPWQPVARAFGNPPGRPGEIVIRDDQGRLLRSQVDRVDPRDPARDVLLWRLSSDVPAGADDYSRDSAYLVAERGTPEPLAGPTVQVLGSRGVKLGNGKLQIWFNLDRGEWGESRPWYSGSATSVVRDDLEILDAHRGMLSWLGHDPEKRCMQIDRLRLSRPAWEPEAFQDESLVAHQYTVLATSDGPVRASVTVASEPFHYSYKDPFSVRQQRLVCRLQRVISLYHDADYVLEELNVRAAHGGEAPESPCSDLYFSARYFAYMDMGLYPRITHFAHIPDWLSIGCSSAPFQTYGFATDVHSAPITSPHPGYPDPAQEHKSFSWELGWSKAARCLHLFGCYAPEEQAAQAGRAWYGHIYKPLRARLCS